MGAEAVLYRGFEQPLVVLQDAIGRCGLEKVRVVLQHQLQTGPGLGGIQEQIELRGCAVYWDRLQP